MFSQSIQIGERILFTTLGNEKVIITRAVMNGHRKAVTRNRLITARENGWSLSNQQDNTHFLFVFNFPANSMRVCADSNHVQLIFK